MMIDLGHSQLSTTFNYSHANRDKRDKVLSIFDKFENGKDFDITAVISIIKDNRYCSITEFRELIDYVVENDDLDYKDKYSVCKSILIENYSYLNNIDDRNVDMSNVFDFIEEIKGRYGNTIYIRKDKKLIESYNKNVNI